VHIERLGAIDATAVRGGLPGHLRRRDAGPDMHAQRARLRVRRGPVQLCTGVRPQTEAAPRKAARWAELALSRVSICALDAAWSSRRWLPRSGSSRR